MVPANTMVVRLLHRSHSGNALHRCTRESAVDKTRETIIPHHQDAGGDDGGRRAIFQKQVDVGRVLYRRCDQSCERAALPISQSTRSWWLVVRHRHPFLT